MLFNVESAETSQVSYADAHQEKKLLTDTKNELKMAYWLPERSELSEEQTHIVESDLDGHVFVTGPAGSGKSVVGVYKLRENVDNGRTRNLCLMYNHSLYGFMSNEAKGGTPGIVVDTKDHYFWSLNYSLNGRLDVNGTYDQKYELVLDQLLNSGGLPYFDLVVVDECQDLSSKELKIIKEMADDIMFLGDFNQSIYKTGLSENDLKCKATYKLDTIYRYGPKILDFAKAFSSDKNFNGSQNASTRSIRAQDEVFVHKAQRLKKDFVSQIIDKYNRPGQRLAFLCPLRNQLADYGGQVVYFANNKDLRAFSFEQPVSLTIFSAKGLEFDAVVVFGFDREMRKSIKESPTNLAYVGCTRARTNLHFVLGPNTADEVRSAVEKKLTEKTIPVFDHD